MLRGRHWFFPITCLIIPFHDTRQALIFSNQSLENSVPWCEAGTDFFQSDTWKFQNDHCWVDLWFTSLLSNSVLIFSNQCSKIPQRSLVSSLWFTSLLSNSVLIFSNQSFENSVPWCDAGTDFFQSVAWKFHFGLFNVDVAGRARTWTIYRTCLFVVAT